MAVLVNPAAISTTETTLKEVAGAGRARGLQIQVFNASTSREINAAFAAFVRERPDALYVGGDAFFQVRRAQLVNLASRHAVPATYGGREFVLAGGLMSYGSNLSDAYRQVGLYAGRILKGGTPADLPVVQATKFELVINAETARMLGLEVPPDAARPRRRGDRMMTPRVHHAARRRGGGVAAGGARASEGLRHRHPGDRSTGTEPGELCGVAQRAA